jgi:hypothetical protein
MEGGRMSFESRTNIKSCRKPKRCYWCGEWIEAGEPCVARAGVWEGDFYSDRVHPECDKATGDWWKTFGKHEYEGPEEGSMKRGSTEPKHEQ